MRLRKHLLAMTLLAFCGYTHCSAQYSPAGDKIKTQWAEEIDPNNVHPEYPRRILERADWLNVNGLWNYAVCPLGQPEPREFDGSSRPKI